MKILANDGISNSGEKVLKEAGLNLLDNRISQEHLIPFINENQVEVLLVKNATQVTKELIDTCPSLKIIGKGGESMDNIEVEYAKSKGIHVINTPNAFAKSVAELVFAHFLTLIRFLHDSNRNMSLEGDSKFDLFYAGAQKNMGPAGTTLVVVKKEILGKSGRVIPSYLDYAQHVAKESMFNTPPVFAVYASLLTLQWLENNGGIAAAEERNIAKAKLLYDEIDRNPLFECFCVPEDRSLMNVSFKITDESKKEAFDNAWKAAGINGLNGHRSLGGYRASLYNALPIESVQVLVDVMKSI